MSSLKQTAWGSLDRTGEIVNLYTLRNSSGRMEVDVCDYGATVVAIRVPDASPNSPLGDVVTGFKSLKGYLNGKCYFGATVGRVANRIGAGEFSIGDEKYSVAKNHPPNALHGGVIGFDKQVWKLISSSASSMTLELFSPHMQEGYPGDLTIQTKYTVTEDNALDIEYRASVKGHPTAINLTNHSYFNLALEYYSDGDNELKTCADIHEQELELKAYGITEVDGESIPSGRIIDFDGLPTDSPLRDFDFRKKTAIGERIENICPGPNAGYDHNYCLEAYQQHGGTETCLFAVVSDPKHSGRVMECYTNQPGCQLYCANWVEPEPDCKRDAQYGKHCTFCLETQNYPDAINNQTEPSAEEKAAGKVKFPNAILRPGEEYFHKTMYKFSTLQ
eukprot:Nk52_evm23s553 gene=Nk52_evmTU23s553